MNQAQPTTIQIAKRRIELQKRRTKKGSRSETSKSQEKKNGRREEEEIKLYLSRSPSLQSLIEIWDFLLDLSRRQQNRRRRRLQQLSLPPPSPITVAARRYQVRSNPPPSPSPSPSPLRCSAESSGKVEFEAGLEPRAFWRPLIFLCTLSQFFAHYF